MRIIWRSMFALGSFLSVALISHNAWAIDNFTGSYKNGSRCGTNYSIVGREPTTAGKYPVFVYTVGTFENHDNGSAIAAIESMANRGYVAATVNYPNGSFGNCSTLQGRAKCIFDANSSTSAIATLCSRAKADCSKGIVVAGFSQGSIMAILAKNYDARVQAAYGMGAGVQYSSYDLRACVADGNRTLLSDRLRAVNGEGDNFMGGNADAGRAQIEQLTGLKCTTTSYACTRSNNSGWYIIKHSEVQDAFADHCYMRASGDCNGSQNSLDQNWQKGSGMWSLEPNLNWLSGFTQK